MRLNVQEQHDMTNELLEGGFNETQSGTLTSVLGKLLERQEAIFNKFREDLRSDIEKMRQEDKLEQEKNFERMREEDKKWREEDRANLKRIEASIQSMREEDIERRTHDWQQFREVLERDRRTNFDDRVRFESQMQRWIINTLTALVAAGVLGGLGALYALLT